MTDRELLELAAKAAGYEYECTSHTGYPENDQHQIRDYRGSLVAWNPLTDDGDALRNDAVLRMDTYKALCDQLGKALEVHQVMTRSIYETHEALTAWRNSK